MNNLGLEFLYILVPFVVSFLTFANIALFVNFLYSSVNDARVRVVFGVEEEMPNVKRLYQVPLSMLVLDLNKSDSKF